MGIWSDWYSKNAGKENRAVNAEFVLKKIDEAIDLKITLIDGAESSALPATASTPLTTLLQTIRNNLKWLFNKTNCPFPVGFIYMSISSANPSAIYPGTTWVAWGSGRAPVGIDTSDTDFNTAEKTGGAKNITLTEAQMPSHKHDVSTQNATHSHDVTDPGHRHPANRQHYNGEGNSCLTGGNESYVPHNNDWWYSTGYAKTGISITGDGSHSHAVSETSKGSSESHSNLQPYITCYMFKRTS
jgi:microcystin-dependent protein